jgi:hypothetical protein
MWWYIPTRPTRILPREVNCQQPEALAGTIQRDRAERYSAGCVPGISMQSGGVGDPQDRSARDQDLSWVTFRNSTHINTLFMGPNLERIQFIECHCGLDTVPLPQQRHCVRAPKSHYPKNVTAGVTRSPSTPTHVTAGPTRSPPTFHR